MRSINSCLQDVILTFIIRIYTVLEATDALIKAFNNGV
jgi:hypothetical protein